ncbi:hypothetical protein E4U31_004262 [Claviceps sp. LM219 group G6]|nr:hypothetical protein E4U31_004262 [Claviceps sp. LM219 group G6]
MYSLAKDSIYVQPFPHEAVHAAATLQFSETSIILRGGQTKSPPLRQKVWVPNVSLYGPAMYIAVNGTDGASLSLPYQEHAVLGSNDTWISSPSPVPSNTTFTIPGPGNAGPNDLLPQLSVKLALGSSKIRADIVRLSPDPKNETLTHETWGLKTIGQPFVFPTHWKPREHNGFPWDGRLDSGSYAPPGTYKFVVRALRINGDERKKED